MYTNISVVKPSGVSSGAAAAKEPNVAIFDFDDVAYFPPRDSKGVVIPGNIIMKPGKKMIQVYMTGSKISAPYESDGDEDAIGIKASFEGQHPGNRLEIKEFIQNWIGRNVGIIHGSCQDNFREVIGTPCAPLQLKPSKQDNNEGRFHALKFEAFAASALLPGHYTGALTLAEPAAVADVGEVALATASGNFYQIPALAETDAIAIASNNFPHGSMVTFLGGGGAAPATLAAGTKVLLTDGVTWTAAVGKSITLEVYDAGADTYLIERSRN